MCSIETSESIKEISAALLAFQGLTHGVVKDSQNPHFRNRYASLEAVVETARPGLQKVGLAFLQAPGRVANGAVEVSTLLVHPESGEWMRSTMSLPLAKQDPQGVGSAITYGCRYALMASLGLPPLDDDAEATRQPVQQERAPEPPKAPLRQMYVGKSKDIYVENSLERIAEFVRERQGGALLEWAKTERQKVWPQYGIEGHDSDGSRIVKAYKEGAKTIAAAMESGA